MVFCGQCGLQLSSGMVRCPRCGAETEITADGGGIEQASDSPTIEATYIQHPQASMHSAQLSFPATPPEQQRLVLRPGSSGSYDYLSAHGNEQTSAMSMPSYQSHANTPIDFYNGVSYPVAPQTVSSPAQSSTIYQNQAGNFTAPEFIQQGVVSPGKAMPSSYPPQKKRRGGGLLTALIVVGLLLILGIGGFFVIQRSHLLGNTIGSTTNGTNTGSTAPTPLTPTGHARAVVQHYYTAINNKNYPEAYSLWRWGANAPTLASFENGYANTEHDNLTIKNVTQLGDGTVRVLLSFIATERANGMLRHHTYAGYYIIGQDGSSWKIFRGFLNRIR